MQRRGATSSGARHALLARLNVEGGYLETAFRAGDAPDDAPPRMPVQGAETSLIGSVATGGKTAVRASTTPPEFRPAVRLDPLGDRDPRCATGTTGLRAVLHVESDREGAFHADDLELADALAALAGTVLARESAIRREDALGQIASALDAVRSEEALIDRVIGVAEGVLRFQACSIFLLDERTDRFVLRGTTSVLRPSIGLLTYARSEGFTGWVCDQGKPILLDDPQGDARWRGKFVEIPSREIASFLAVPIVKRGRSWGAIPGPPAQDEEPLPGQPVHHGRPAPHAGRRRPVRDGPGEPPPLREHGAERADGRLGRAQREEQPP